MPVSRQNKSAKSASGIVTSSKGSFAANGDHSSRYLPQLDGARGLAAVFVVVAHFNPAPLKVAEGSAIGGLMRVAGQLALGNLAVIFFFALSAFLLTFLARVEYETTGDFSIRRFLLRRVLRIWPLYFTVVGVAFLFQGLHAHMPGEFGASEETWRWITARIPLYAFFAGNWSLAFNHVNGYLDHSPGPLRILWSVNVEEQFYLLYPLVILLVWRFSKSRWGILGGLLLAGWVFRLWFCQLPVTDGKFGSSGGMYYATFSYIDVLICGGVAGWCFAGGGVSNSRWLTSWWTGPLLVSAAAMVGAIWSPHVWSPYDALSVAGYSIAGIVFALLLFWLATRPDHPLVRVLASRPMRLLGTFSFGVYMWHIVSNLCLAAMLNRWGARDSFWYLSPWFRLGCSLGLAISFAALSWRLIERPFLQIKRRFAPGRAKTHPDSTAL